MLRKQFQHNTDAINYVQKCRHFADLTHKY